MLRIVILVVLFLVISFSLIYSQDSPDNVINSNVLTSTSIEIEKFDPDKIDSVEILRLKYKQMRDAAKTYRQAYYDLRAEYDKVAALVKDNNKQKIIVETYENLKKSNAELIKQNALLQTQQKVLEDQLKLIQRANALLKVTISSHEKTIEELNAFSTALPTDIAYANSYLTFKIKDKTYIAPWKLPIRPAVIPYVRLGGSTKLGTFGLIGAEGVMPLGLIDFVGLGSAGLKIGFTGQENYTEAYFNIGVGYYFSF